ncbi:MAG: squalene synthase HpnC [Sphingomonadales bacterium]
MTGAGATRVETPSGKGAADENFPVGSFLMAAHLRPHVATFYAFARAIDDVADNPDRASADKVAVLDGFARAVAGQGDGPAEDAAFVKAHRMRESLAQTGITARHCLDLISAFKQDAVKSRYGDWDELIDYCNRSAAPVGRYLLDLHGEGTGGYVFSDALCNALQVINHLQDCQDDYRAMDRVYLPTDWMAECGADVGELDADASGVALRAVLDRALDGVEQLLGQARQLPGRLESRRLAMESAVIVSIAERLTAMLRGRDPIAGRVELTKTQFLGCAVRGLWRLLFTGK